MTINITSISTQLNMINVITNQLLHESCGAKKLAIKDNTQNKVNNSVNDALNASFVIILSNSCKIIDVITIILHEINKLIKV